MHISPQVFWPYFAGTAAACIGLVRKRRQLRRARGLDALLILAPVFVAIGMAIFGGDHLVAPKTVAFVVPKWMPWREFWAIFVGIALEAAALGLASGIRATLAAGLLGFMIFCFALFVFVPLWVSAPRNTVFVVLLLRDLMLGWSFMAFAARGSPGNPAADERRPPSAIVAVARFVCAAGIGVYGVMQLMNPSEAPGYPPEGGGVKTMPGFLPWHPFWGCVSGVIFVLCAIGLIFPRHARKSALVLGVTTFVTVLLVYVPLTVSEGSNIDEGLNYLAIHFALAGAMLGLSAACRNSAPGVGTG